MASPEALGGYDQPLTLDGKPGEMPEEDIVQALEGYRQEAEQARRSGPNPRDERWEKNLDLYWNRMDFSGKAAWQAKEVLPEVPGFVDRFAAALKEALIATPGGFYEIKDPADRERDLTQAIKSMTDVWLSRSGRNQHGVILGFPAVFEEQMKLGALMASAATVTWKRDHGHGRVAIEAVDPRHIWLDPTNRGLYRIRRSEQDLAFLHEMAQKKDSKGRPIYRLPEVERLIGGIAEEDRLRREALVGHGAEAGVNRNTITLDEYLATVVSPDGKVMHKDALFIVANGKYLVRGPEKNPFQHGRDWMIYAPLVTAPLSVYGRSYMEDFGDLAKTFNTLTNLILDSVFITSMKAFAMVPGMLLNPAQANSGIHPGKIFLLEEGFRPEDFAKALDLGTLSSDSVRVWEMLKTELREGAGINEIGLGQFAPNSRTSATEITETQQSSSALIRSVANTVETRVLDPWLDLTWKTGLQHASEDDEILRAAATPDLFDALMVNRKELIGRPMTFQARGISAMIQKGRMLRALLQLLQIVAQSEPLLAAFMQKVDVNKLVDLLLYLHDVDPTQLELSAREQMMKQIMGPMQELQGQGQSGQGSTGSPGQAAIQQIAQQLGING